MENCFQLDIIGSTDCCYKHWWDTGEKVKCGGLNGLARHEVFFGANRKKSIELGCVVWLCNRDCHIYGPTSPHACPDGDFAVSLKQDCQQWVQDTYGLDIERFRTEFGRSYL